MISKNQTRELAPPQNQGCQKKKMEHNGPMPFNDIQVGLLQIMIDKRTKKRKVKPCQAR